MAKTLLITGASSGLGAGMAQEFARRGYDLALCARRVQRLAEVQAAVRQIAPQCRVSVKALDVDDHAQVFAVFRAFKEEFGVLDKIIVNAGIARGAPVGRGGFAENRATLMTNYVAAFAQAEAAMEIFRAQEYGHLAVVSSISALRGLRGGMTAYASSKAAVAAMAEGIRADVLKKPRIKVSTLFPGYIHTEITAGMDPKKTIGIVGAEKACRLLADAVERAPAKAYIPLRWAFVGFLMRYAPLSWVAKFS